MADHKINTIDRLKAIVVLVALITACALYSHHCLTFSKDVFRVARSELHLLIFRLEWGRSSISSHPPPLTLLSSPGLIYIAHAAGQVNGKPAKNSLEGFNESFNSGCRFIEADFNWTRDHYLVSSHQWLTFFGETLPQVPSLRDFVSRKRLDGLTQLTFDDVDKWLLEHPSAKLVSDVKSNNIEALAIFRNANSFKQIIPQTYSYMEYIAAKKLGFRDVILTTYNTYYSNSSLRRFAEIAHPSAITLPVERLSPELIVMMNELGVPVFTHPVPTRSDLESLPKGVKGIYSSTLCE